MNNITILMQKKFLRFPISCHVPMKKVLLFHNDQVIFEADLRLTDNEPTDYAEVDIRSFSGMEVTLSIPDNIKYIEHQTDEPLVRLDTQRPYLHFTARYGWMNDPNGLVEYTSPVTGQKTYHMFYQHNPYDTVWGNMHWGHAISSDLLHWEHLGDAITPDELGTIFSGSAIIDRENRSGLKSGDEDVILLFYTAAGHTSSRSKDQQFTQCLAYSTDGGQTVKKYEHNPILSHIRSDNRDPKVVWCEELDRFVMAIYLDGNEYAFHTSSDLIHWEFLQNIAIEDDAECPDFYPLNADGDPQKRRWIITGAFHRYLVCDCYEGKFRILQNSRPLHYGPFSYASQTFSDVSDGRRINIAWDRGLDYPDGLCFNGQMGIPMEMTLKTCSEGYCLCAEPIRELAMLERDSQTFLNLILDPDAPFTLTLMPASYQIETDLSCVTSTVTISLFGHSLVLEPTHNRMHVGNYSAPLSLEGQVGRLRMLIDRYSLELCAGNGEILMTVPFLYDDTMNQLQIFAENKTVLSRFTVKTLSL